VIKKWLSYREHESLAARSRWTKRVPNIARRVAAILLMEPELETNDEAVKKAAHGGACID
jgi:hypothetical protein